MERRILNIDEFLDARPDMVSFSENSIQSAINQAQALLDSETGGLMVRVWDFNKLDPQFAQDSESKELLRSDWELGQIVQAMITQTQYTLNMGNDFTVGSESFSIGGVNGSFQRPEGRDPIAPGVIKLLQNARVYKLTNYGNGIVEQDNSNDCVDYDQDCITYNIGDKRYLSTYQENAKVGNVAYINGSHMIDFGNPQDLNITTYSTKKILDTQTNNYVEIDKIKDLCFFGKNLYGYKSGVERGELLNLLSLVNMNWRDDFTYRKDNLLTYAYEDSKGKWFVQDFLALQDNKGKNPLENPDVWQPLGVINTDINELVQLVFDRVIAKYDPTIETIETNINNNSNNINNNIIAIDEINKNLTTTNEKVEDNSQRIEALETKPILTLIGKKGTLDFFDNIQEFEEFTAMYNLENLVDYTILPKGLLGSNPSGERWGSKTITQTHLPNLIGEFFVRWNVIPSWSAQKGLITTQTVGNSDNGGLLETGNYKYTKVLFTLNPDTQIDFEPYVENPLITIKWMKNVWKEVKDEE